MGAEAWKTQEPKIADRVKEIKAAAFLAGGELSETWIRQVSFQEVLGTLLCNGVDLHVFLRGINVSTLH